MKTKLTYLKTDIEGESLEAGFLFDKNSFIYRATSAVGCDMCGQPKGYVCVTRTGKRASHIHAPRHKEYRKLAKEKQGGAVSDVLAPYASKSELGISNALLVKQRGEIDDLKESVRVLEARMNAPKFQTPSEKRLFSDMREIRHRLNMLEQNISILAKTTESHKNSISTLNDWNRSHSANIRELRELRERAEANPYRRDNELTTTPSNPETDPQDDTNFKTKLDRAKWKYRNTEGYPEFPVVCVDYINLLEQQVVCLTADKVRYKNEVRHAKDQRERLVSHMLNYARALEDRANSIGDDNE